MLLLFNLTNSRKIKISLFSDVIMQILTQFVLITTKLLRYAEFYGSRNSIFLFNISKEVES